jgi:hypothetical protein
LLGTSPRLIAADHVLRRLSAPKHPPHTLSSLTTELRAPRGRSTKSFPRSHRRPLAGTRHELALVIRLGSRRCGNPCSDFKDRVGRAVHALRIRPPRDRARGPGARAARGRRGRRSRTVGAASVRRRGDCPRRSLVVRRKEVIQPQVLLRLPCYDLVPIIELTFGTFLPCGLERRLRVLPTFVA